MKTRYFILLLLCTISFAQGQNVPTDSTKKPPPDSIKLIQNTASEQYKKYLPNPTPLSPNAASFQKFGDYPVNLSTGLPDISIPLYTATEGELSVPIVLRYHAGGHRISERASWVGWGWSLAVGGSVNRRMQGIPDDADGENYLNKPIQNTLSLCTNSVDYGYASGIRSGLADGEPDIYSFSFPGGGGRFLNGQGTDAPFMIPSQPVKVEKQVVGGKIRGFDIFAPNGTMYEFGANTGSRETQSQTAGSASSNFHVSTWHLDSIKSAVTDDKIAFSYQAGGSITQNSRQWSVSIIANASPNNGQPYQNSVSVQATPTNVTFINSQLHPHRITYANGEVEFVQSTSSEVRADIAESSYLKQINIYNYEGGVKTLQKVVKFTYSYFDDVDGNDARLKLDRLTIADVNETDSEVYAMGYWTDSFSWKDDLNVYNNQDYFGFFNGANNQSLIELSNYNVGTPQNPNLVAITNGGADRSTVATYLKEGILKTLTYPTKGYTTFDYEGNRYKVGGTEYLAGGLRLKEMVQYPLTGEPMLKRYEYGSALGAGIGELPTTWTPQTANLARTQRLDFNGSGTAAPIATATQHIITPNGQVDMGSFDSNPVYYTQVSEYFESGTATLTNGRNDYIFSRHQDIVVSVAPPFQRDIRPWRRGQLLSKKTYDRTNNLVSEQVNTYTATDITQTAAVHIDSRNVYEGGGHVSACATGYLGSGTTPEMLYSTYNYWSGSSLPTSTTSMLDGVSTTRTTAYNTNLFPVSMTEERSIAGASKTTGYVYPDNSNYAAVGYAQELLNRHMLNMVLETTESETEGASTVQTFQHKRVFGTFTGGNAQGFTNNLLPKEEWVAPMGTVLEKRVEFTDYDTDGNVLSYTVDGVPTSLLWGYANQLVVGMVQNADQSSVAAALTSSGLDPAAFNSGSLTTAQRTAIADFQEDIPTSLSTWYAYRPHIGMTLQVTPNGLLMTYSYDNFGRLQHVKDNQGDVVETYRYNYQEQP